MRPESRRPDAVFFRLVGRNSVTRLLTPVTIRVLAVLYPVLLLAALHRGASPPAESSRVRCFARAGPYTRSCAQAKRVPRRVETAGAVTNLRRDTELRNLGAVCSRSGSTAGQVISTGPVLLASRFFHGSRRAHLLLNCSARQEAMYRESRLSTITSAGLRGARRHWIAIGVPDRDPAGPRLHDRVSDRRAAAPVHRSEDEPLAQGVHRTDRPARFPSARVRARSLRGRGHPGRPPRPGDHADRASERERPLAGAALGKARRGRGADQADRLSEPAAGAQGDRRSDPGEGARLARRAAGDLPAQDQPLRDSRRAT